jgi:hypothetical protein
VERGASEHGDAAAAAEERLDSRPGIDRKSASVGQHEDVDIVDLQALGKLGDGRRTLHGEPSESLVEDVIVDRRCIDGGEAGRAKDERTCLP